MKTIAYYFRFEGKPITRCVYPWPNMTHVCMVDWVDDQGETGELTGFANSHESALRTAKNLSTRHYEKHPGDVEYSTTLVVSVGIDPSVFVGIKGVDRFLKLYWKPKGMPKKWNKHLHFKGRYLVVGESVRSYFVMLLGQEYKITKSTMEISFRDETGKTINGGPIFLKDF